jgi:hypothetical protein
MCVEPFGAQRFDALGQDVDECDLVPGVQKTLTRGGTDDSGTHDEDSSHEGTSS